MKLAAQNSSRNFFRFFRLKTIKLNVWLMIGSVTICARPDFALCPDFALNRYYGEHSIVSRASISPPASLHSRFWTQTLRFVCDDKRWHSWVTACVTILPNNFEVAFATFKTNKSHWHFLRTRRYLFSTLSILFVQIEYHWRSPRQKKIHSEKSAVKVLSREIFKTPRSSSI